MSEQKRAGANGNGGAQSAEMLDACSPSFMLAEKNPACHVGGRRLEWTQNSGLTLSVPRNQTQRPSVRWCTTL